MIQIILDKLIRMKIIQSCSFVNWLFSKDMENDFLRYYAFFSKYRRLKIPIQGARFGLVRSNIRA